MAEDQIIAVARALAQSKGAAQLTMNAVAEAAGISRATLYRRFPSKAALLEQLHAHGVEQPVSTRERILAVMAQRVGVEGDLNVTIDEVAQLAGVSAMSIYRSFGDRDSLMAAFLDQVSPREHTRSLIAKGGCINEVLLGVARVAISLAQRCPGLLLAAMTDSSAGEALDGLRRTTQTTRKQLVTYFKAASARGQLVDEDPKLLVAYWIAMTLAEPVFLRRVDPRATIDVERSARRAVDTFLSAYGAKHE